MKKCKCKGIGLQIYVAGGLAKPKAVQYVNKQPFMLCTDCNGMAADYPGTSAHKRLKLLIDLLIKAQKK